MHEVLPQLRRMTGIKEISVYTSSIEVSKCKRGWEFFMQNTMPTSYKIKEIENADRRLLNNQSIHYPQIPTGKSDIRCFTLE